MADNYISFLKNPMIAGLIVGGLTFAWFKYNDMKIPDEKKVPDNKMYIVPLIVAFVTGILVYFLFRNDAEIAKINSAVDINNEIIKENALSTGSTIFVKNGIQVPDFLPKLPDALINIAK
jgi:fructose-specific phosphotransferase system IIC component